MIDSLIFANIAFAIVLLATPFEKQLHAKAATLVWSALTTGYLYYLVRISGASSPSITLFDRAELPLFLFPGLVLLVLVLATTNGRWATARFLAMLVIVAPATILRQLPQADTLVYRSGIGTSRVLALMLFTVAIQLCLLAPATMFAGGGKSIGSRLLPLSVAGFSKHLKTLLGGMGIIVGIVCISHLAIYGRLVHIHMEYPLVPLVLKVVLWGGYFVFISHFLGIGLMRYLMSLVLGKERIWVAEVILYAGVFALLSYAFKPLYLVREFLYGLVFAHWYMKTETLAYGIIIGAILWIFLM